MNRRQRSSGERGGESPRELPRRSAEERRRYLAQLLRANPLQDANEIVQARTEFFGFENRSPEATAAELSEVLAIRQFATQQIEDVRAQFWNMQLGSIREALGELQLDEFPDLAHAANRLRTVADHRGEFPEMTKRRGFDGMFFECLKQVLVRSPRDAAEQRELGIRMMQQSRRAKRVRRMLRALRNDTPRLYELEAEWFDSLQRQRVGPRASERAPAGADGADVREFGCVWWFVGAAIVRILVQVFRE